MGPVRMNTEEGTERRPIGHPLLFHGTPRIYARSLERV
jgi:hypothetical protein